MLKRLTAKHLQVIFVSSVFAIRIMVDLRPVADEYFRSINPIAKRIFDDVQATKENYESAWTYLSTQEQTQVLDESLIYPDAVLKYSMLTSNDPAPSLQLSYGCKILQDETGAQWRDEHSAPFSWKTSSQLHIDKFAALPQQEQPVPAVKKRPPVPPPKPPKPQVAQVPDPEPMAPQEDDLPLPASSSSEHLGEDLPTSSTQVWLVT